RSQGAARTPADRTGGDGRRARRPAPRSGCEAPAAVPGTGASRMTAPAVIAVDGGGSKTDVALVRADGEALALVRGPSSQAHHLGVEGSLDVIEGLLDEALAAAKLEARIGSVAEVAADRKSTRLNSSHGSISYAVFCLRKK